MARKQLSGSQKRKKARDKAAAALAAGVLVPRSPTSAELGSLTGVAREQNRNYRDWRQGRLTNDQYLVAVRGLSAMVAAYNATELQRQNDLDERLTRAIEAHDTAQVGAPVVQLPGPTEPLAGEFIPRETSNDEVSE
jgi:hypothetical protein